MSAKEGRINGTKFHRTRQGWIRLLLCAVCLLLLTGCGVDFTDEETSPGGTHQLLIAYDYVSRPTIYEVNGSYQQTVFQYEGSGFMETVAFHVEWLDEDTFNLSCAQYDECYTVHLTPGGIQPAVDTTKPVLFIGLLIVLTTFFVLHRLFRSMDRPSPHDER